VSDGVGLLGVSAARLSVLRHARRLRCVADLLAAAPAAPERAHGFPSEPLFAVFGFAASTSTFVSLPPWSLTHQFSAIALIQYISKSNQSMQDQAHPAFSRFPCTSSTKPLDAPRQRSALANPTAPQLCKIFRSPTPH
jgi:hypothetical protein